MTEFVKQWEHCVKHRDMKAADKLFAHNASFTSPVVHTPSKDPIYIRRILTWVTEIIEGFHYKGIELMNDDINDLRVGLVFGGKCKDKNNEKHLDVEGIDLFKLNKNGQITELRVMLRPLNATICLAQQMRSRFMKLKQSKM